MKLSLLSIVSRNPRVVSYELDGISHTVQLSDKPTCNTGDVQKSFNHHVRQGRQEEALSYLQSKAEGVFS